MPVSEAKKKSNTKHDKENFQYISFKARKGSRDNIVKAAAATNQSVNGFIRTALSKAVEEAIGEPMEPVRNEVEEPDTTQEPKTKHAISFKKIMEEDERKNTSAKPIKPLTQKEIEDLNRQISKERGQELISEDNLQL